MWSKDSNPSPEARRIITLLGLEPHPQEGGFFKETYRIGNQEDFGRGKSGDCTAIYYMLTGGCRSLLHQLPTDEIFHFYAGDPVNMLWLLPDGSSRTWTLGSDPVAGHTPQLVVPAGVWQGSALVAGGEYALMGTTMAPGFRGEDFKEGQREVLLHRYPQEDRLIRALTRD